MMHLAIDPGVTVGWARRYTEGLLYFSEECKADEVWSLLNNEKPDCLIVERYVHAPLVKSDQLVAVEVIGVVKEWARQRRISVYLQTASQVKHYFTDARLKERELYKRMMPHANDAMRHLLYFLEFGGKA